MKGKLVTGAVLLGLALVLYGGISAQCHSLGIQITNLVTLNWAALDWGDVDCS